MSNATAKARSLTAAQPTQTLITSLRAVADPKTAEEKLVRAWIIDELEKRYPAASDAVSAAFDAEMAAIVAGIDHPEVDYVATLLVAVDGLAR